MNYYEVLGVERDAHDTEIKKTYKRLAKKYHPDVYVGDPEVAHLRMMEINKAYDILGDNAKREEYDYSHWKTKNDYASAKYKHEFRDYVPRGSRVYPDDIHTEREDFHGEKKYKSKINIKLFQRTTFVMRALTIIVPLFLLYIIIGIYTDSSRVMNFLDNAVYGRGSPDKVSQLYINSLKEQNRERAEQLISGAVMSGINQSAFAAYNFETADGVKLGRLLFEPARDLSITTGKTERQGFNSASVEVEVRNLNTEIFFVIAMVNIQQDLEKGTGDETLNRLLQTGDISLVGDVYETYFNEVFETSPPEYISATVTFHFTRRYSMWRISGCSNPELLENIIIGGLGNRGGIEEYLTIDWHEVLEIE